jgi:hypothetical protein
MDHCSESESTDGTPIGKVVASLRTNGALRTFSLIGKNVAYYGRGYLDRSFDRRYGTRTSGLVLLESLAIDSVNAPFGVYYEATPVGVFHRIFDRLDIDLTRFCYIDYGSGMGRTLLMASDYPFTFIRGIEFSETLHTIAERNVAVYRSRRQRCFDIRSLCVDAATFDAPPLPTVFYLYNPFDAPLMKVVFQRIENSIAAHPREIHIIYYNPLSGFILEEMGFMTRKRVIPLRYDFTHKVQRRAFVYSYYPDVSSDG